MTADPLEKIRAGLLTGVAAEPRRSKRRRVVAALVAVAALFAGGVALASPWGDRADDAVIAGEGGNPSDPATDGPAMPSSPSTWSIEEPSGWQRAGRELMPNLGWDSLTIATIPLEHGGERCAQVPEQALRDLGAEDALVSIFFNVSPADSASPWPSEVSDLPGLENSDPAECADRSDLQIRWAHIERAEVAFYVLVALGPDASDAVREEASAALRSFQPVGGSNAARAPECVVTVPPAVQPDLPTAEGVAAGPGKGWVGTEDLWTVLPLSGVHQQRKSAWWSQHFPGGSVEERPELRVTWDRQDEAVPSIVAEPPGQNGYGMEAGWFMLNGIDPDARGCWKVTAEYKGHRLSYVYWNPVDLDTLDSTATERQRAVRDGLMPELVGHDLNTLGDVEGVLFELQDVLGQQTTRNVANDAPEGTVIAQTPAPGTPLDQVEQWELTVSAGGPVVAFEFLPPDVISFARGLPGMNVEEPLVERVTEFGTVYKTDRWLFGLDCDAVDAAYRTFSDARYDTTCPERFEASGG
ncbi:hypothetical protein NHL50_16975 [Acidimicrobiia bacterium EGI L10123]|uniref:hypothetical protein n=1 Tax=Salinilacustrithrix flava TaxID=2957203 RepID=UPI003D7C1D2E|nr:hypothetical protein [Acidimicrobiia bacterium EGI L10123]